MTLALEISQTKPHDHWLDREIVRRVLRGRFDLVHRPLSHAERVAVVGPILDATVEAARVGKVPDLPMSVVAKQLGFGNGTVLAKICQEARPDHAQRMKEARAEYVSFYDVASGHVMGRRRVTGMKIGDPRVKAQRKRWNSRGLPA